MQKWLVIGGGNGGHATAGHIGLLGEEVRLYDIAQETCDKINEQGGIYLEGAIEGFGKIEFATTDIKKALDGVDNIIVVAPSFAHEDIARKCAPWLKSGQKVLINPSTMFGSLAFKKIIKDQGNDQDIAIGETISLMYAARLIESGRVKVLGIKNILPIAVFPNSKLNEFVEVFGGLFPQMKNTYRNVFETGLQNLGCIMHPLPTIASVALIESDRDWNYYYDGITESVGKAIKTLDNERVSVCKALGVCDKTLEESMEELYDTHGNSVSEMIRNIDAYAGVKGQHKLETRYLTEEIPFSMLPIMSLAKKVDVATPVMEATVVMAESLLGKDLRCNARTLESLGLGDYTKKELVDYVEHGREKEKTYE